MPRGGARAGAGRPQDPNALRTDRRKDLSGLILLPADGRKGDPPAWPLSGQSEREMEMWERFWRKPQAIIWEHLHYVETVALFVRQFCEGEVTGNSAENRKAIQSYFSVLCLTPPSLKAAGYAIASDEVEQKRQGREAEPPRSSSRSRLRAVPDGDGG